MREVWKFNVPVNDQAHDIDIPGDARLVHVDSLILGIVSMWYEVNLEELADTQSRTRRFRVFGTGHPISNEWSWVGTAVMIRATGALVWHLYEDESA